MTTNKQLSPAAQAVWNRALAMAQEYGKVQNEVISSPGKFEGEWFPVIYFWGQALDGGDFYFDLTPDEQEAFDAKTCSLDETDSGFVLMTLM